MLFTEGRVNIYIYMDHSVHTNLYLMSEAQLRLFFWLTALTVSSAAISLLQGRISPLLK